MEYDHAHPHPERVRAGFHQRMDLSVPEFLDVLILQSFQYFRFLDGQAVFGRHAWNVINQPDPQVLLKSQIVEDLVQFVCRRRGMLVKFVAL